eukprot:278731_1
MAAKLTIFVFLVVLIYASLMKYEFTAKTQWRQVVKVDEEPTKSLSFVWNILYDFKEYPKWNTFTYKVERQENNFATVLVKLKQPFLKDKYSNLSLSFKFIEITENKKICWSYQMVPEWIQPFILKTKRCMEIKLDDNNKYVLLRHFDINQGPLSPIVQFLFKDSIEIGFEQMTDDFVKYAKRKFP